MCNGSFLPNDNSHFMKPADESDLGKLLELVLAAPRVVNLHGPPQSGKTTLYLALMARLRASSKIPVVDISLERLGLLEKTNSVEVWTAINKEWQRRRRKRAWP